MKQIILYSSSLFTNPSFLKGIARLADIGGQLDEYAHSDSEAEADSEALRRDWVIVGQDISKAASLYKNSNGKKRDSTT